MIASLIDEAIRTIKEETKHYVQQAFQEGDISTLPTKLKEVLFRVLVKLEEKSEGKEGIKEIADQIRSYCNDLEKDYKVTYQTIIDSDVSSFFKKEKLPDEAIYFLWKNKIQNLGMIERLRDDPEYRNEISKELGHPQWAKLLEIAVSGSKIQTFLKHNDLRNSGGSKSLKDSEKIKNDESVKKIEDLIEEVDKFREQVKDSNTENQEKSSPEVEKNLEKLNSKLLALKMTLNLPTIDNIKELKEQLTERKKTLEEMFKRDAKASLDISTFKLIQKTKMLHGYYFDETGTVREANEIIRLIPDALNDEDVLNGYLKEGTSFQIKTNNSGDAEKLERIQQKAAFEGRNFSANLKASATNFIIGGSLNVQHTKDKVSEETKVSGEGSTTFSYSETLQILSQKTELVMNPDHLIFVKNAVEWLQIILKKEDEKEINDSLERFFRYYGTHIVPRGKLGGYYEIWASTNEVTTENKMEAQKAVAEKVSTLFSIAAKFLSPTLLVSLGGAYANKKNNAGGEKTISESSKKSWIIKNECSVQGGIETSSIPSWLDSLEYNSSWKVVGREFGHMVAIWDLLWNHKGYDFTDDEIRKLRKMMTNFFEKKKIEREQEEERKLKESVEKKRREENEATKESFKKEFEGIKLLENDIVGVEYNMAKIEPLLFDKLMTQIGEKLHFLKILSLRSTDLSDITDTELIQLGGLLGYKLSFLETLNLSFNSNKIEEDGINFLAQQIATRKTSLKHLSLALNTYKISSEVSSNLAITIVSKHVDLKSLSLEFASMTDKGIASIAQAIQENLKSLQTLKLNFNIPRKITEAGIQSITKMLDADLKDLQNLSLDFGNEEIKAATFRNLFTKITEKLSSLNSLNLEFNIKDLVDKDLGTIAKQISDKHATLRSLSLRFSSEKITNKGAKEFINILGDKLTSLENLSFYFTSNDIKDAVHDFGSQIEKFKALKHLIINFGSRKITEKDFQIFMLKIEKNLTALQSLNLSFYDMKISSSGLKWCAGKNFQFLETLSLSCDGTRLEEDAIPKFALEARNNLKKLQNLGLTLGIQPHKKSNAYISFDLEIKKHLPSVILNLYLRDQN